MSTTVRNFIPGEVLPSALRTGYEQGNCDPRWLWLAVDESGRPCAIVVAAPAHIAVIFIRVAATESAPPNAVGHLLRVAMAECSARGYQAYVTWVNPQRPAEASLMKLIRLHGGQQSSELHVGCLGWTNGTKMSLPVEALCPG